MVLQAERYNGGYQQQYYSSYQGPTSNYSNFQGVTDYSSPNPGPFQVPTYPSTHGPHHQPGWSSGSEYYGSGANHHLGGGIGTLVKPATNGYGSSYYETSYTYGSPNHHGHGSPNHHAHGSPNHHGHGSPNHHAHGSPNHHGHDSPNHHGHGSGPHGFGKTQGFGGAIANQVHKLTQGHNNYGSGSPNNHGHGPDHQGHGSSHGFGKTQGFGGAIINKMTHGHNNHGSGSPNYGHGPSGYNHGYHQQHPPQQPPPSWTVKGLSDDDD